MKFLDRNINPVVETENNMMASLDNYKFNKDASKKKEYNDNTNNRKKHDYGFKLRARNKNLNLNEKVFLLY